MILQDKNPIYHSEFKIGGAGTKFY